MSDDLFSCNCPECTADDDVCPFCGSDTPFYTDWLGNSVSGDMYGFYCCEAFAESRNVATVGADEYEGEEDIPF